MKIKIISLVLIIFFISGCSQKNELDEVSEAIIKYHQDYNYDISHLSKNSQEVLLKFKEQEKKQNKTINISKLDLFNEYLATNKPNSPGVYVVNGDYYIKYKDLNFYKINEDYLATICVNGYEIDLAKNNFPILYEETKNINYEYRYMSKIEDNNLIKYYYRSYGDGSMLTIEYEMAGENIKNINLLYNDYYLLDENESVIPDKTNIVVILLIAIILVFLVFIIIKLIRRNRVERKI